MSVGVAGIFCQTPLVASGVSEGNPKLPVKQAACDIRIQPAQATRHSRLIHAHRVPGHRITSSR
jgi:hypothetical protein